MVVRAAVPRGGVDPRRARRHRDRRRRDRAHRGGRRPRHAEGVGGYLAHHRDDREVLRDRERRRRGAVTTDPYGSLDPSSGPPSPVPLIREAGTARVLTRGARKRCPRCGERAVWLTWFKAKPLCPTCGLRFEGEEGGF